MSVETTPGPRKFRGHIERAEAGRFHLYVSYACPWASRAIIIRAVKGLEDAISMSTLDPVRDERGWAFRPLRGGQEDPVNGFELLRDAYRATDPRYEGGITIPVLWDKQENRIVNNESVDVVRILACEFNEFATSDVDLYPPELREEIDAIAERIQRDVNQGVYRAGFAKTQAAYESAYDRYFATLDHLDALLADRRYLCGSAITLADWRLFTTAVRHDPVYHGHFKLNERRLVDYENLWPYIRDLYQQPKISDTVDLDQIKGHYYCSQPDLDPSEIVPKGPPIDFAEPHGREALG
jgi:putative glutathione S-transferase